MIQSMTGFGKATGEYRGKKIVVEIKTLNSKQIDISTRIASLYREKDIEIRNELSSTLDRGKIELALYIENTGKESVPQFNSEIIDSYYQQIKSISQATGIPVSDNILELLLRLPEVLKSEQAELDEQEWIMVKHILAQAIQNVKEFRQLEGRALEGMFRENIAKIAYLLIEINPYENERIEKIKARLDEHLQQLADKLEFNSNRLEQELIFYMERLDISEEKLRLKTHLDYFLNTLEMEVNPGKKLHFITQEIGREINTLGSKSNHSEMQKLVVEMKDKLEQIKEQVANIL